MRILAQSRLDLAREGGGGGGELTEARSQKYRAFARFRTRASDSDTILHARYVKVRDLRTISHPPRPILHASP